MPRGVKLVAFADNLAIVVTNATEVTAGTDANRTINRIPESIIFSRLELAPEKPEALMLKVHRNSQHGDPEVVIYRGAPSTHVYAV